MFHLAREKITQNPPDETQSHGWTHEPPGSCLVATTCRSAGTLSRTAGLPLISPIYFSFYYLLHLFLGTKTHSNPLLIVFLTCMNYRSPRKEPITPFRFNQARKTKTKHHPTAPFQSFCANFVFLSVRFDPKPRG